MQFQETEILSMRYASSLINVASKKNLRVIGKTFFEVSSVFLGDSSLGEFFHSKIISLQEKKNLTKRLIDSLVQDVSSRAVLMGFFDVLLNRKREYLLKKIVKNVYRNLERRDNVFWGEVILPRDIPLDELPSFDRIIQKEYKKFGLESSSIQVQFEKKVSPDILGSFVIIFNGYSVDFSFHSYLQVWKENVLRVRRVSK